MDFNFSDDQEQLRDAVRKWVDKGYDFERRRSIVSAGGFDRAAYGELADLGLTALTVPEQHGGLGLGAVDAMVVMAVAHCQRRSLGGAGAAGTQGPLPP